MSNLLDEAYAEAKKLPEGDQEAIGAWLLAEISSERRWDELFARPSPIIERMADEGSGAHRSGKTLPLDPDTL